MLERCGIMFDIEFYRLPDGSAPVEEFLRSLAPKMRVKAVNSIALLEEFGNQLRNRIQNQLKMDCLNFGSSLQATLHESSTSSELATELF